MSDLSIAVAIDRHLNRHRMADQLPYRAMGNHRLVVMKSDGQTWLGATLMALPLGGADATTVTRLQSAVSMPLPPGSFLQIQTLSIPDVDGPINAYLARKQMAMLTGKVPEAACDRLMNHATTRAAMFSNGRKRSIFPASGVRSNRAVLLFSIKIPVVSTLGDSEFADMNDRVSRLEQSLRTTGFPVRRLDAGELLGCLRSLFDPWAPHDPVHDPDLELREQIVPPGFTTKIDPQTGNITFNDQTHVRVLSVKRYPKRTSLAMMFQVIGDPTGLNNQITCPYLASLTFHYPDQVATAEKINSKALWITHMASSMMAKWSPKIALKKQGFDVLTQEMANGGLYTKMSFQLTLLGDDASAVSTLASGLSTYYASFGFDMREERGIVWPMFYNTLPLAPTSKTIERTERYRTMSIRQAVQFSPVYGEYLGSHDPAAIFQTRHGHIFGFDLYDSPTNYNAAMFGESGGGKSVTMQQLITDYLAIGAKVWVMDAGRSYEKLCKYHQGQFIEFSENSDLCLNPFTQVEDIDEDMPVLKALLAAMAAPNDGLDDYRMARLEEAIKAVWSARGQHMDVTAVADYMAQQDDPRIQDIAAQLFQFTERGSFGRWFNGRCNLDFNNNFIVLETDDLKNKQGLHKVVQLALIARVQHAMYIAGTDTPKIFIADEVKENLPDRGFRYFLTSSYSRFRKYEGAAIIVLQSISTLDEYPDLTAVIDNCRHKIILQQTESAIKRVQDSGVLGLDPYAYQQMRTVHTSPGEYSEAMFVSGTAWTINRHIMDPFTRIMTSTKGPERHRVFELMKAGLSAEAAIHQVQAEQEAHA